MMIKQHEKGILIRVHVTSRAKQRTVSINTDSSEVHVNVKAAPVRGQANREMVNLIAKRLGISTSKITIVSGSSSPRKTILVEGLDSEQVIRALRD